MDRPLLGCSILLVEDEPVIAMHVRHHLEQAGASVSVAQTLGDAMVKVEAPDLSAGVVDHRLSDGDSSQICARLEARSIPFVTYSGFNQVEGPCSEGRHLRKPVRPEVVVVTLADLLLCGPATSSR